MFLAAIEPSTEDKVRAHIAQYRAQGHSDAQIRQALLNSKIDPATISRLMSAKPKAAKPFYKKWRFLIPAILLGIFLILLIAFILSEQVAPPEEALVTDEEEIFPLAEEEVVVEERGGIEPQCGDDICDIGEEGCVADCGCIVDQDCQSDYVCEDHVCEEEIISGGGGGGGGGGDGGAAGEEPAGEEIAEPAAACTTDSDCSGGYVCDTSTSTCYTSCTSHEQCASNSACVTDASSSNFGTCSTCSDTDGGEDIFIQGTVTGSWLITGVLQSGTDSCDEAGLVQEYSCRTGDGSGIEGVTADNTFAYYQTIACDAGYACSDGVCVRPAEDCNSYTDDDGDGAIDSTGGCDLDGDQTLDYICGCYVPEHRDLGFTQYVDCEKSGLDVLDCLQDPCTSVGDIDIDEDYGCYDLDQGVFVPETSVIISTCQNLGTSDYPQYADTYRYYQPDSDCVETPVETDCSDYQDNDRDGTADSTGGCDLDGDRTLDYLCGCYVPEHRDLGFTQYVDCEKSGLDVLDCLQDPCTFVGDIDIDEDYGCYDLDQGAFVPETSVIISTCQNLATSDYPQYAGSYDYLEPDTDCLAGVVPVSAPYSAASVCDEDADCTGENQVCVSFVCYTAECADSIDNDGDSFIDFVDDPDCTGSTDNSESSDGVTLAYAPEVTEEGFFAGVWSAIIEFLFVVK